MLYDRNSAKCVLSKLKLSQCSLELVKIWLSHWDGSALPGRGSINLQKLGSLEGNTVICIIKATGRVEVVAHGSNIPKAAGGSITGQNLLSLSPPEFRREHQARAYRVAKGNILSSLRRTPLLGGDCDLESICLPMRPIQGDGVPIIYHFGGLSKIPCTKALSAYLAIPDSSELLPIPRMTYTPAIDRTSKASAGSRAKGISRAMVRMLLNFVSEAIAASPSRELDPIDILLANAIGSANISHIENNRVLRERYAECIEPDTIRRGISRAAISRAMSLPLETVRRRINKLIDLGVLIERPDGIILSATNAHHIDTQMERMFTHAHLMERMCQELAVRGIVVAAPNTPRSPSTSFESARDQPH